ncbi:hypothetical protein ABBQ38_003244 [Trebouxia sp. C0009 RCD-2024]
MSARHTRTFKQTQGTATKRSHSLLKGPKADKKGDQKSKSGKLTSTKNKIRGVQRLLRKAGVDSKLRRSLEAKLLELQESLKKHNKEELERKFAVRYHKIRFFERIKLERRIKQLSGKAQRGHALSATEQQQIQKLKQDLQYVLHFPKGERYVSILKDAAEPEAQAKLDAERIRLKAVIKRQLAESAMLTEADEGLSLAESTAKDQSDCEGDAFFLDSGGDLSSEERLTSSALPLSPSRNKRRHADFAARVASTDVAQQAPDSIVQPAHGVPKVLHEQPAVRRQALAVKPPVQRVRSGSQADVSGPNSPLQDPQQDRPLALQSSQPSAERNARAQLMPGFLPSLRPGGSHDQSLSKGDSATQKCEDGLRQAVATLNEGAKMSAGRSAASRSQLLLQRLEQKYAKSRQQSRLDMPVRTSKRTSAQQLHDRKQPSKLAASTARLPHAHTPELPKSVGKAVVMPNVKQTSTPIATGPNPVRTRAEGGRRRRK